MIDESASGSSTVVDEISGALVEMASREVCVGRTSPLDRLALIATLFKGAVEVIDKDADCESTIDEVAKDSTTDDSVGKLVVVISSSV